MHAAWPVSGEINQSLLISSQYLMECAREFRLRLKNMIAAANKKVMKITLVLIIFSYNKKLIN